MLCKLRMHAGQGCSSAGHEQTTYLQAAAHAPEDAIAGVVLINCAGGMNNKVSLACSCRVANYQSVCLRQSSHESGLTSCNWSQNRPGLHAEHVLTFMICNSAVVLSGNLR